MYAVYKAEKQGRFPLFSQRTSWQCESITLPPFTLFIHYTRNGSVDNQTDTQSFIQVRHLGRITFLHPHR